jgi:hypothetical protein
MLRTSPRAGVEREDARTGADRRQKRAGASHSRCRQRSAAFVLACSPLPNALPRGTDELDARGSRRETSDPGRAHEHVFRHEDGHVVFEARALEICRRGRGSRARRDRVAAGRAMPTRATP